jgi:type I restriction enzyme S subunit
VKAAWETKQLSEVAELQGRIGWKGLTAKEYTPEGPYFLSVHSLNYGDFVDFRDAFHISQERYDESPEIMLQRDDVLICKDGAGIGKVGIVDSLPGPSTINSSLLLIRAKSNILPKYLYLVLQSPYFQAIVQSRLEGATTPHLYQRDVATFPIPLPPLEEQRRIVAVLDEAFAAINTATAHAEKNLANARELFESELRAALLEADGAMTTLGSATDIRVGFAFKSGGYSEDVEDIPLIRGDNIVQGRLRWNNLKRWPKINAGQYDAYRLAVGDVVLAMDRTWIKAGLKYAVIGPRDVPSLLVQRVARLRANNIALPDFIALQIASPAFTEYVLSIQTGLGVPHISGKQIADYSFRLPDLRRQKKIVGKLLEVRRASDRLTDSYSSKRRSLEQLRQSLLQRAFSGQLAEREPLAA